MGAVIELPPEEVLEEEFNKHPTIGSEIAIMLQNMVDANLAKPFDVEKSVEQIEWSQGSPIGKGKSFEIVAAHEFALPDIRPEGSVNISDTGPSGTIAGHS